MTVDCSRNLDRAKSAAGVFVFHILLGYALLTGLTLQRFEEPAEKLQTFDVAAEVPPPPQEPPPPAGQKTQKNKAPDPEGAASPPNLKDTPTPIMAPAPRVRLEVPPPITAAPIAGQGNAPAAGAAPIPGPGTGSGGIGVGTGSGANGTGTGGGGGGSGAVGTPSGARFIRGGFRDPDYPRSAYEARREGVVVARLVVAWNGRVSSCRVTQSSGVPALDLATCRVIRNRFEFTPARNAKGRPVQDIVEWKHSWIIKEVAGRAAEPASKGFKPRP